MREFTFKYIETTRFKLRIFEALSYQGFLKEATDEEIMYYTGIPAELIAAEKNKAKFGFRTHNKSYVMFVIVDKQTGEAIGDCGYHTWYLEHNRAEIGYRLFDDAHKKQGVMTEVLAKVLEFGFTLLKLKRVEALVSPFNEASLRTVQRFSFIAEGRLKSHYMKGGKIEDSIIFGLQSIDYFAEIENRE